MPNGAPKALHKFQQPLPKKPQYAPHTWTPLVYGPKVQYVPPPETLLILDKKGTKRVQSVTGAFGCHSGDVNPTMIVAVNEISSDQSAPTAKTTKQCNMLLDYAHIHIQIQ